LANRLWIHHKEDRSDPSVLWRRFVTLSDNIEDLPTRHQQKSPSSTNQSTSIDWIASINFEVPAVVVVADATSGGDNAGTSAISSNFRGMVCWLFETTENDDHHPSIVEDSSLCHPPSSAERFLRSATNHIAATYALESFRHLPLPRRRSSARKLVETTATNNSRRRRMPPKLCYNDALDTNDEGKRTMSSLEINGIGDDNDDDGDESGHDGKSKILAAIRAYFRKYKGGGNKGPQPLCGKQTLFTFVGSFVTIFLIHSFNVFLTSTRETIQSVTDTTMTNPTNIEIIKAWWDTNDDPPFSALEMGPFGATCVLIFAMTTVAPAQPRSVLVGATIGMVVGKLIGYLEAIGIGLGIRMALATALTASIMARTCTIYPPAGALAIIFSSQLLGWDKFLLQVFGTVLTFTLGVVINNIHPQRTYPTFWVGIEGCGSSGGRNKRASGSESVGGGGGGCRSRV
jgi:hypothetical protein